jgi:hypothetical protein
MTSSLPEELGDGGAAAVEAALHAASGEIHATAHRRVGRLDHREILERPRPLQSGEGFACSHGAVRRQLASDLSAAALLGQRLRLDEDAD